MLCGFKTGFFFNFMRAILFNISWMSMKIVVNYIKSMEIVLKFFFSGL